MKNISLLQNQIYNSEKLNTSIPQRRLAQSALKTETSDSFSYQKQTNNISFKGVKSLFRLQVEALRLLNRLPVKLSPQDTPRVKMARQAMLEAAHKIKPTSSNNSPARQILRSQIASHFLQAQDGVDLLTA